MLRMLLLVTFLTTAFAGVDLPLLVKQNLAQPCLSVSYAPSANATVKAKTDAKNAELVQAGLNSIFFSVDWNQLEASPGVIDLTPMTNVIQLVNLINSTVPMAMYLLVKTIDTTIVRAPSDLVSGSFDLKAGLLWNDTTVVTRFNTVMDSVLSWLATHANTAYLISIGNEVDVWLANHPTQQSAYVSFVSQVLAHCRATSPAMGFAVTMTFDGGVSKRKTEGFEWADALMTLSDTNVVTYYPLNPNFTVRDPAGTTADVDKAVAVTDANKKVVYQEIGYPSGYEPVANDSSSLQKQAAFVAVFYNATLPHRNRIAQLNFFLLMDMNFSIDYGFTNPQFTEYLDTIGVMRADGSSKPAADQLVGAFKAIRSATAPPATTTATSTAPPTTTTSTTTTSTTTPPSSSASVTFFSSIRVLLLASILCVL